MPAKSYPIAQGTPEGDAHWHQLRKQHIGASEISALMGCHPYHTAFELYHIRRGGKDLFEENTLTEWGKYVEPFVARVVARKMGWRLRKSKVYLEHENLPFLGTTLDYDVVESEFGPGVLEIKVVTHDARGDWGTDRAPEYVEWQIQQQLMITGYSWGAIAAMFWGDPDSTRIMLREPNPKAFKAIEKKGLNFWKALQEGREPDAEGADYPLLTDIWKERAAEEDGVYQPPLDISDVDGIDSDLDDWEFHKAEAAKHSKKADEYKAKLLQLALQRAEGKAPRFLTTMQYELEVKEVHRAAFSVKASSNIQLKLRKTDIVGGNYGQ